jgi:hypothetical protein
MCANRMLMVVTPTCDCSIFGQPWGSRHPWLFLELVRDPGFQLSFWVGFDSFGGDATMEILD